MNKRARTLRKNQTDAEKCLWRHLRNRQLMNHKFRRQYSVGRYIADFACTSCRLIVEVDGGQHDEQRDHDAARTTELEAAGYRVLRFWNNEVLAQTESVLEVIRLALLEEPKRGFAASPSSQPSPPVGEKGQEETAASQPDSLSPIGGEGWGEGAP